MDDFRTHVSMARWMEEVPLVTKGEYRLTVPEVQVCYGCEVPIADGEQAWVRGTWDHGVQTSHTIWHDECWPFKYIEPVPPPRLLARLLARLRRKSS